MTVDGHIENGQIVLNQEISLPEGMKVRVEFVSPEPVEESTKEATSEELPSLYERMKPVVGAAKGLPADYAINHDHYLHGQPKRQ
jgi:predicted DNA-binding antitoxin AbrB/MazE fold protein